jgi:hypothetical protein
MRFPNILLRWKSRGALLVLLLAAGCAHFEPPVTREYVYVLVDNASLRDRVAVVSNRVAEVANGQRLQVVEHGRRFLKVKTERGDVGWIEDHEVIDQKTFDAFAQLEKDNAQDPVVGTGTLREQYWLHAAPGRQTSRFYLLAEDAKLQLLARASVPKPATAQAAPVPVPVEQGKTGKKPAAPDAPPAPQLEDYWLVRDGAEHVGWVRARALDEDVPDAIAGLGEGQKIVGAYVLRTVEDPGANMPGDQVAEYVAVLAPWKDGLPYDFDQVRVFTWNVKKHRYETAYRERDLAGFLPVTVGKQAFGKEEEPVFSFRVATGDSVALDPTTGMVKPADTAMESFHLEGVIVRRIDGPPAARATVAGGTENRQGKPHKRRQG